MAESNVKAVREPVEDAESCARRILETIPAVMRLFRREMRHEAREKLTVPQFRVLAFVGRRPGASLSEAAEYIGIANATASTMVDRLVRRKLVARATDPKERRRMELRLTKPGSVLLESARALTRARVAERLSTLNGAELRRLAEGLELLHRTLGSTEESRRQA